MRKSMASSPHKLYSYSITLRVDPVNLGFTLRKPRWNRPFRGLFSLNQYFAMLAPNDHGYTLPDVWDGYYQMTLVKFDTRLSTAELQRMFHRFQPNLERIPIETALFKSTGLVRHSGENRTAGRGGTDYIALKIEGPEEFQFGPLMRHMKAQFEHTKWLEITPDKLHLNVRLYPEETAWTWGKMRECEMDRRVEQFPIDFRCAALEVIPTRRQCIDDYKRSRNDQWWEGVTESDQLFEGCHSSIRGRWAGACLECGEYERLKPIWRIPS
jgi:hypothetical protein